VFERFLDLLLSLTESEYGFIGEVLHTAEGQPYLKTFAITNIAWDEDTRRFYDENVQEGMEFRNLKTLFGAVLTTRDIVLSNDPSKDARRGGLPQGHPALNAFLGLPIESQGEMIGMIGIANRPGGYDREVASFVQPLLLTCGSFIRTLRIENKRSAAERRLREKEARNQAILESSLDAIITIDVNGTVESVNPATERMFGYEHEQLVGENISMLMPEPDRSRHDSYLRRYLETGEAKIIGKGREVIAIRKDGSRFPAELAVTELTVPGQQLFTGIVKDISERKRAQVRLEDTLEQLQLSNENMLAILNETRIGVVMIDESHRVVFASRSCERLLQKASQDLVGQPWGTICPFDASEKREVQALFSANKEKRSRVSARLSLPGGRDFWAEVEVKDDPRNPQSKILFLYDVTEVHSLRSVLNVANTRQMVGQSRVMQEMFKLLDKVSAGDWTVLIEGETGVGKELVARGLHAASERKDGPFIPVNCGGLTSSLLTSQLFGHRRGSFTGAAADQEGLFEAAHLGTLFLDEIGELPLDIQAALLRVLQEKEITPVGETKPRQVDIRILAATNRDLVEEAKAGRFRKDLLYRIRVARILVPPLRDRREDIPHLIETFLAGARHSIHRPVSGVSKEVTQRLMDYSWPGNVRELKNCIETAVINCPGSIIRLNDLPPELRDVRHGPSGEIALAGDSLADLQDALDRAGGNRSQAAALLGISRATLYRRLTEAGIKKKRSGGKQRTRPS
jgi:PAS domain S-box-containing protein